MWQDFRHTLEHHPAKWMIWEGEPLPAITQQLKDLGVRSTVFDPCGNLPESGDFLSVMKANIDSLKRVFDGSD
jgi:zinc transport system substrate-binding protein